MLATRPVWPRRPLLARPRVARRQAERRALGVRSAAVAPRGDAAHGGHRRVCTTHKIHLFVQWVVPCVALTVYGTLFAILWSSALFSLCIVIMNTHDIHAFSYMVLSAHCSLTHSIACAHDPLRDSKRRTARSKEATRRTQDER